MKPTVGVIQLQGVAGMWQDYRDPAWQVIPIGEPEHLADCDALIIPGGDSHVIARGMWSSGLADAIKARCAAEPNFPVLGICAGLVIMATFVANNPSEKEATKPLELLPITVWRYAWGRKPDPGCMFDRYVEGLGGMTFIEAPIIIAGDGDVLGRTFWYGQLAESQFSHIALFGGMYTVAIRFRNLVGIAGHSPLIRDIWRKGCLKTEE